MEMAPRDKEGFNMMLARWTIQRNWLTRKVRPRLAGEKNLRVLNLNSRLAVAVSSNVTWLCEFYEAKWKAGKNASYESCWSIYLTFSRATDASKNGFAIFALRKCSGILVIPHSILCLAIKLSFFFIEKFIIFYIKCNLKSVLKSYCYLR